ncbi:MAG: hypothetical protein RTV31_06550 [Candidatus Thorarchaeota archaeon]
MNQEDIWIPYFSLSDVPHSLPLRGFISDSRNYFFDFGAFNWLTEWVESHWGYSVPDYEKELDETHLATQLLYLFENATNHLTRPQNYVDVDRGYVVVDYVKDFDAPFEAFIPLVVMYGLNETYDDTNIDEWVIHPDVIENSLSESFPLIDWTVELYWFDYNNHTEFADLMSEKTQDVRIMIDDDFLSRSDTIIHDIVSSEPRYTSADIVLPALVMLQHNALWATYYDMAVGGLGRLDSVYPEIDTWCLNGRSVHSYFYGGDPEKPRTAITPTVIHELGHCVGQTDIHSEFGWLAASTCMSTMAAYQQTTIFDRFDMDMINHAQALQLWGRYLDEIDFFNGFSLTPTRQNQLNALESSLSNVPEFLRLYDYTQLRALFYDADDLLSLISSELTEPRKSSDWSDNSPALDVHVDWIIGPGIPDAETLAESIEADIDTVRDIITCTNTNLPSPLYNLTIEVHSTIQAYDDGIFQDWARQLTPANTSLYSHEDVPVDAWATMPRNRIFQVQSGYEIDGYAVEDWLTTNRYTAEVDDAIHYRFYIMNLEDIVQVEPMSLLELVPYILVGTAVAGVVTLVVIRSKKQKLL